MCFIRPLDPCSESDFLVPHDLIFYFGLRSPYAWLAQKLLNEHLPAEYKAKIRCMPYWDPAPETLSAFREACGEPLYRPMSRERHLYILQDIKRTAHRLGYTLRWPVDGMSSDWELPHRACLAADAEGHGDLLRNALFAARWEQGHDICDPKILHEVLISNGLADTLSIETLRCEALSTTCLDILKLAQDQGVFGLPTFVLGRERWWGVDRLPFALQSAGLPWKGLAAAWCGIEVSQGVVETGFT